LLAVALASACGGGAPSPLSASGSSVAVSPSTAFADGAAPSTTTVTVRDEGNGPMAGVTVAFAATGSGNAWTPASAVTNESGVATSALTSTTAGAKTVSVTANGMAITQTQAVTFTPRPSPAGSTVVASPTTSSANGVAPVTAVAAVRDWSNAPMSGVTVVFAATGGGNTWTPPSAVTDGNGVATSALTSTAAETKTVSVTADGVTVTRTLAVIFTAPPSASKSSLTASPATALADGTAAVTATATARDESGTPVAGVAVVFAATGSGHTWTPPSAVTNGSGVATSALTSTTGEAKTVHATADGVAITQAQAVTFVPVPSASMSSLAMNPTTAPADLISDLTATVTVRDAGKVPLPGVTVVFAATGSENTWQPPSGLTNEFGIATATLSSTVAETKTVSASANGVNVSQTQAVIFTPQLPATSDLLITEVGNWYYRGVPAWLEIFNGTRGDLDLSLYSIRAPAIDADTLTCTVAESTFSISGSKFLLPAGSFAVVAGKVYAANYDGGLLVHVADESGRAPCWSGSGFVELLKDGRTVDFVRFGTNTTIPKTPEAWSGENADVFPVGATSYNVALARLPVTAATRTRSDWKQVQFATPGGLNDVAPEAKASDGDGVPDSAKLPGGTFAGIDLHALGARPGQVDVFIELDAMDSTDPGIVPRIEALNAVVARFKGKKFREKPIHLHVDAGNRFANGFDPDRYSLGQKSWRVPYAICVNFPGNAPGCAGDIYAYKAQHMDLPRRAMFHYVLFGSSQNADGRRGSSGRADVVGSNLIVTLGRWNLGVADVANLNTTVNLQASTFMHEFGHNLGLLHGGNENQNYKPNYLSIMNYLHQLTGLPDPMAASAGDRYAYRVYPTPAPNLCSLDASPCVEPAKFRMDFSDGSGADLDQEKVSETGGLGRGGPWVDFDGSGLLNDGYPLVLNPSERTRVPGKLKDFDDWTNLKLPFQTNAPWLHGGASVREASIQEASIPRSPLAPFDDHTRQVSSEEEPPASFFESLPGGGAAR
jgi:hypothetical protein